MPVQDGQMLKFRKDNVLVSVQSSTRWGETRPW
jgi:hypothetical protein